MIPQLVLLETPPEVSYLEEMFERHDYRPAHFEKVLSTIVFLLRSRRNASEEVPLWIERFRYSDLVVGELLYRPMQAMSEHFFQQISDWGLYLADGQMPYDYASREPETVLLEYDQAYQSLRPSNNARSSFHPLR